ncbi:MAG: SGNH/GDSL hydrolase family protein [Planctomycetales bacterium]|nr:SGNH/GDSL hydrolase family protein [Planctomycetales bacterium]
MLSRAKYFGIRLLVLSLALVVGVLLGEGLLRAFATRSVADHRLCCEFDPVLGWQKIPSAETWHVTDEYQVLERFNSHGLRGPECDYEKPAGVRRLLVLGDSFVEGYSVEFEQTLTQVLQERLNRDVSKSANPATERFEVINAGTGGYSTDQEYLFFVGEGHKYHPDVTILAFYDNDPWYNAQANYWRGAKPLFALDEDGPLRLTNVPLAPPANAGPRSSDVKPWLDRHSRVYGLLRTTVKRSPMLRRGAAAAGLISADEAHSLWRELEVYALNPGPEMVMAWRTTSVLIQALRTKAKAAGSQLVVFYVPPAHAFDAQRWRELLSGAGLSPSDYDRSHALAGLQEICQASGIDLIDPTDELHAANARRLSEDAPLYFPVDGHWTASGHRVAAEVLEQYFRRSLEIDQAE